MALHADDGSSYHRHRPRFDVGLTPTPSERLLDPRVELIIELISELSDVRRARLVRRLEEIDSSN
jgi:hypothetical protein